MLVARADRTRAARRWRSAFWLSLAALVLATSALAPHFRSSTELVRMRNALLMTANSGAVFDWTPASVPNDFLLERSAAAPRFTAVVNGLGLDRLPSDWDRAVAIGRHLLVSAGAGGGGAIQADLDTTYDRIVKKGDGYCGDFADVFTGLSLAAGIPVRAWAFSFDGFGGHGHIFNEIWDAQARRWRMIDVFNNVFFTRADGDPLSALAFREALRSNATDLRRMPVHPGVPLRYQYEAKAWDYYRAGLPEWYLWWGNNVFTYDRSLPVRVLGGASRSLEQLAAIFAGVHPRIRVLESAENAPQREAMGRLRLHLMIVIVLGVSTLVLLAIWVVADRRSAR